MASIIVMSFFSTIITITYGFALEFMRQQKIVTLFSKNYGIMIISMIGGNTLTIEIC